MVVFINKMYVACPDRSIMRLGSGREVDCSVYRPIPLYIKKISYRDLKGYGYGSRSRRKM